MRFGDYIPRAVDGDCLRALRAGRNFYVFGPPQTGKTWLRRRMADTLRASGLRVVEIDLAARGGGELFFDLAMACAVQFGLGDPARFWDSYRDLEPAERWQRFLQSAPAGGPVVLLIDSVEALLAAGDDIEAFFSALRPPKVIGRTPVVTCLFGAVERVDLGVDIRIASLGQSHARAWFRTAVQMRPEPFSAEEIELVLPRLAAPGGDARALLDGIMHWTAGHPALTMALVDAIADGGPLMVSGSETDTVAATVDALFIDADPVPTFAAAEAWADCVDPAATGRFWARIRQGQPVDWRPGLEAHRHLRMAGLARVDGAVLRPANRLFTAVFDERWCDARTLSAGLMARARAWAESDRDGCYLLEGDLLRRASDWAEGREIDEALSELLVASWVQARHSEQPPAVTAPPGAMPRGVVPSAPPMSMVETAPPGLIAAAPVARVDAPVEVPVEASAQAPAPQTVGAPSAVRWLAVTVAAMALLTTGLLAALWQTRGGADEAIAALMGNAQPSGTSTSTATSRPGTASASTDRFAALEAAVARAEARLDVLESETPPSPVPAVAVTEVAPASPAGAARPAATDDAALTARALAAEQAAVEQRRRTRLEAAKQARARAEAQARAEKKAAAREAAAQKAADARARRRAERRAERRRLAEQRASREAAQAALDARRDAAEQAAARPGPIAPPPPAVAIARQAPSYRRALVRCKHIDLPQQVRLTLTVQPDGRVADAVVARGDAGRVDRRCLVDGARRFRFAPFSGSAVTAAVDYRL